MRVGVTGASGFIGAHVIAQLIQAGHTPIAFVRSASRFDHAMDLHGLSGADRPQHIVGDVTDPDAIAQLCAEIDAIVHTAGIVTTKDADETQVMQTNVGGTTNVIGAARAAGLDPIVHVSSVAAVFPSAPPTSALERMSSDDPITTNQSLYARSKAGAERVARQAQDADEPVVIFYPGGVFGPHDPGTSDLIDGTLLMLDKGAFLLPKGRGNSFIDVRDLAAAVVRSIEPNRGPRRFMAGGIWVDWDEWIGHFVEHTGTKIKILTLPSAAMHRLGSGLDWVADRIGRFDNPLTAEMVAFMSWATPTDDELIHSELGVQYRPIGDSVREFVDWLRADGRLH